MDPFTGLGSTAVACARLGVEFVGAEIDETYLKEAVARTTNVVAELKAAALDIKPQAKKAELRKVAKVRPA